MQRKHRPRERKSLYSWSERRQLDLDLGLAVGVGDGAVNNEMAREEWVERDSLSGGLGWM